MKLAIANICASASKTLYGGQIGAIAVFAPPNSATVTSAAPKDDGMP